MSKTSWQTGNLKMNEDLKYPSRACFVRGCRCWEEDILIAEIEELEKLDASEIYPRRLNAKEVHPEKMENLYFLRRTHV